VPVKVKHRPHRSNESLENCHYEQPNACCDDLASGRRSPNAEPDVVATGKMQEWHHRADSRGRALS
jgi:hypothetical protein